MSPPKNLDFLVIGAQKAGTTSLFEYVRLHPGLHLPSEKEVSYFNLESRVARGWDWYLGWVFAGAPTDRPWGTFSTFYMDAAEGREDTVPRRIRETVPDAKLIAILRDPVSRCISHHRMSVMKRLERRPFGDRDGRAPARGGTRRRTAPADRNELIRDPRRVRASTRELPRALPSRAAPGRVRRGSRTRPRLCAAGDLLLRGGRPRLRASERRGTLPPRGGPAADRLA